MTPPPAEVGSGVWRLPVPLRGHSVGHVNAYAFLDRDGVLLVDTGWEVEGTWEALDALLGVAGASVHDVTGVLLTHVHADHCGLARRLQRESGAWIGMHHLDAGVVGARYTAGDPGGFLEATVHLLQEAGVPEEMQAFARRHAGDSVELAAPFEADVLLDERQPVSHGSRTFTVLHTPGHTSGHVCFYEQQSKLMMTGDHVLPLIRVSPNYRPQSPPDPIGGYLASLDMLGALPVSTALPGHQRPFTDFADRLSALRTYHERRLEEIRGLVETDPGTAWEICARIHRSREWSKLRPNAQIVALGETLAHLRRLAALGAIEMSDDLPSRWTASR